MDGPDTAPILQTLTQYSYADTVRTPDTIDAINNQAYLFLGGNTLSAAHTLTIKSAAGVTFTAGYCPTFQANDQLTVTLSGDNAVQGLENVLVQKGAAGLTFPVGAFTNAMPLQLTRANLLALGITAGPEAIDIAFQVVLQAKADTELKARIITATPELDLVDTGNASLTGPLAYAPFDIFRLVQNGTLFRLPRFTTKDDQETNVRFTNSGNNDVSFDVRFFPKDGAPTAWARFAVNNIDTPIKAMDSLSITVAQTKDLLGLGDNVWGFVEYRLHTALENVTAQAFSKSGTNFSFNIPIQYWDADAASPSWK